MPLVLRRLIWLFIVVCNTKDRVSVRMKFKGTSFGVDVVGPGEETALALLKVLRRYPRRNIPGDGSLGSTRTVTHSDLVLSYHGGPYTTDFSPGLLS